MDRAAHANDLHHRKLTGQMTHSSRWSLTPQWGRGYAFQTSYNLSQQSWWYVALVEEKLRKPEYSTQPVMGLKIFSYRWREIFLLTCCGAFCESHQVRCLFCSSAGGLECTVGYLVMADSYKISDYSSSAFPSFSFFLIQYPRWWWLQQEKQEENLLEELPP